MARGGVRLFTEPMIERRLSGHLRASQRVAPRRNVLPEMSSLGVTARAEEALLLHNIMRSLTIVAKINHHVASRVIIVKCI